MTFPDIDIIDLRSAPQFLPEIAAWHHAEWLKGRSGVEDDYTEASSGRLSDIHEREHSLREHLGEASIPTSFIAKSCRQVVGSVSLVNYQFSREQNPRQWLTNLFVAEEFRCRGIAGSLLQRCVSFAKEVGLKELSLYTRDYGSFYRKRGWQFSHRGIVQGQGVDVLKILFAS